MPGPIIRIPEHDFVRSFELYTTVPSPSLIATLMPMKVPAALNEDAEPSKLGSIVTTVTWLRERRLNSGRIDDLAVIGVPNWSLLRARFSSRVCGIPREILKRLGYAKPFTRKKRGGHWHLCCVDVCSALHRAKARTQPVSRACSRKGVLETVRRRQGGRAIPKGACTHCRGRFRNVTTDHQNPCSPVETEVELDSHRLMPA